MNEEVTIQELFQRMLQTFDGLQNPEELKNPSPEDEFDPAHPCTLLVMLKWYHNPEDFAQYLIDHYDGTKDDEEKMKVAKTMRYWQLQFNEDFRFNSEVKRKMAQLQQLMRKNADIDLLEFMELDFVAEDRWGRSSSLKTPQHIIRRPSLGFDSLSASDLAEILTSIDYKLFRRVPLREFCMYAKTAQLSKETPRTEECIRQFNGVTNWVVCNILREYTMIKRADIIEKFIDTTKRLFEIHSFNSMLAVVGGLNHFAVRRLQQTWGRVQAKKREELEKFTEFFSIEFNYGQYRQKVQQVDVREFQLPVLGIVLKDLVAIDSQLKDYTDKSRGSLNLAKYQRLLTQLGRIRENQVNPPDFHPDNDQMTVMRAAVSQSHMDDEALEDLSKTREPPVEDNKGSPTRHVSSLPKFADWAAGDMPQLGAEMVKKHVAKMVDSVFRAYDKDQSGYISIDEFQTISSNFPFIESFSVLDRDKDGVISRDEMMDYFLSANTSLRESFKHNFVEHTFIGTSYCEHCKGVLKGIVRQGVRCKDCGISCHKHCKDYVVVDCSKTQKKSKRSRRALSTNTSNGEFDYDEELSLRERLHRAEAARDALSAENTELHARLAEANAKIQELNGYIAMIRQHTIGFILEQMNTLQPQMDTAV